MYKNMYIYIPPDRPTEERHPRPLGTKPQQDLSPAETVCISKYTPSGLRMYKYKQYVELVYRFAFRRKEPVEEVFSACLVHLHVPSKLAIDRPIVAR
jgi:hypothetical protein